MRRALNPSFPSKETTTYSVEISNNIVGVFITEPNGTCIGIDQAFTKITGVQEADILGEIWTKKIDSRDFYHVSWAKAKARQNNTLFHTEIRFRRADTTTGYLSIQETPQFEGDELVGYTGTVTDITDRKRAEHTLRQLHKISSSTDLCSSEKINELLALGVEVFDQPIAVLSRIDGDSYLVKEAISPSLLIRKGTKLDTSETYCNKAFESAEPVAFETTVNSHWAAHPCCTVHNINSYLGTRLIIEGKPYGTLSFSNTSHIKRQFSRQDKELLALMAQWVTGEIQRHMAEERLAYNEHKFEQIAAEERVLGKLLQLSVGMKPMKPYLEKALTTLLNSISWLKLLPKGGIFIVNSTDTDHLHLAASHNLDEMIKQGCSKVRMNACICGESALEKEPKFASCILDPISGPGSCTINSGHYNLPILAGNELLGLIMLYLTPDSLENPRAASFLSRVANVIGMGIKKRHAEQEIEHFAFHDPLTGLPNQRLLLDHLSQEIQAANRHNELGAIFFIDLDKFKTLNDAMGHSAGDALLIQVAMRLKKKIRSVDTVARLGGDEFAIIATRLGSSHEKVVADAHTLAEKLNEALSQPYILESQELQINASIGISLFPDASRPAEEMLSYANTAMSRAKSDGRNQVRFFEADMQALADSRLALERDLGIALKKEEFSLYYQPQLDVDGKLVGVEALVRWQCSRRNQLIPPAEFIPLAEENGMIIPLGAWVMETAIKQYHLWSVQGLINLHQTMAINISPREFLKPNLIPDIQTLLDRYQVPGKSIKLEITEGIVIDNLNQCIDTMNALRNLGISISIDDFGTGYSSLSYLRHLPINQLKIDQSFVKDLPNEKSAGRIIETIISMAEHLDLNLIAEGVETEKQWDYLASWGCQAFQGYLLSHPLSTDQTKDYLQQINHEPAMRQLC